MGFNFNISLKDSNFFQITIRSSFRFVSDGAPGEIETV